MKLLTQDILKKLPPLYSQENVEDPMVWAKFFTPDSSWTWLATEYSPEERLFFGFVIGDFPESGYFGLDELEDATGPMGLHIERDMYFRPKPLSQAKAEEMGQGIVKPENVIEIPETQASQRRRMASWEDEQSGLIDRALESGIDEYTEADEVADAAEAADKFIARDRGGGNTRYSLEFFDENVDMFDKFVHAWFVYDKEKAHYELHLEDRNGDEMILEGCSFGYGGEGPHGSMEVLQKAGFPITSYLAGIIFGHATTPTRGEVRLADSPKIRLGPRPVPPEVLEALSVEEGGPAPKLTVNDRNRMNREIHALGDHFETLGDAVDSVIEIVRRHGGNSVGLEGIYTGRQGEAHTEISANGWGWVHMTWYELESGRMEVITYVG